MGVVLAFLADAYQVSQALGWWAVIALLLLGIVIFLFFTILDKDRTDSFRAKLYGFLSSVTKKQDFEKKFISNDVRSRINKARKKLHFGYTLLPNAVDVEWIDTTTPESFNIKDNQFVVKLDRKKNQIQNIITLTEVIVGRTTLIGLRHAIDEPVQTAIDLTLTRKLLNKLNNGHILDWFLSNDYQDFINKSETHKLRGRQIAEIDDKGLFTRILLLELDDFAKKIRGKDPRPYMAGEVEGLISFLQGIANKPPRIEVPLTFLKAFIRIGVVIVADTDKILTSIDNYVKAVQINLKNQARSIYFIVYDKDYLTENSNADYEQFNIQVDALSKEIAENTILHEYFDIRYNTTDSYGNRRRARCIRYIGPDIYDE